MIRFRPHRSDSTTESYPDLSTILSLSWVARFREDDYIGGGSVFHQFSMEPDIRWRGEDSTILLAEYDRGARWWVVGYLAGGGPYDLPVIRYGKAEERGNPMEVIAGRS